MSWVLYDPPEQYNDPPGDVDAVIIVANTPSGQIFGEYYISQAIDQFISNNLFTEFGAYDPAVALGDRIAQTLADIQDLTVAGVQIVATTNPPGQYGKIEGINMDSDAFEEVFVGVRNVNGQLRYTLFVDSGSDNAYDRRIELGGLN